MQGNCLNIWKYFIVAAMVIYQSNFNAVLAQVSISQPNPDVDKDTVTITFDPNDGNGVFARYQGPVYIHSGVVTNRSNLP